MDGIVVDSGDRGVEALKQFHNDLLTQSDLVLCSLADELRRHNNGHLPENHLKATVRETDTNVYLLETNIGEKSQLTALGKQALMAVGGLNLRIEEMQRHKALSGFVPEEVFIFGKKKELLQHQSEPNPSDRRFERVLTVSNLPQPNYNQTDIRIDVNKLLQARSSPECVEFREWLRTSDDYTDKQVHRMVKGFRARFSELVHAPLGKTLRILLAAKLGGTPGALLGALDMFLVDRLLPRSGPAAFLSRK